MTPVEFYKYQGTGNDFVILDNYTQPAPELDHEQIKKICHRQYGIGADGLMYLNRKEGYDFEMTYFNSDGHESSMCGNGGRCLVHFAHKMGIHKNMYRFLAVDGEHQAEIDLDGIIALKMNDVTRVDAHGDHFVLNTGSPHYVKFIADVIGAEIIEHARHIRNSEPFRAESINVNFVETISPDTIYVRTYERGVEDETLSCGTGVTACALMCAHNEKGFNTVKVRTPGGNLKVEFERVEDNHFTDIWLCGPAEFVFKGVIEI